MIAIRDNVLTRARVPAPTAGPAAPMRFRGLLSRRAVVLLTALLVMGLVVRVIIAFATYGGHYDVHSWEITARALRSSGSGVYDPVNGAVRWPYPGGFLPLLAACDWISRHLGLKFDGVVQLPAIITDIGIAYLVMVALRWSGASERRALVGAALVALGPSFILISGYAAQIDSAGALPALAGALVWMRGGRRRALWAGLLIGLAASVKQPFVFTALALLPTARSWREAVTVVAGTVAVPFVSVLPFLLRAPHEVVAAMKQNSGVPGFGGISAFVEPDLTRFWATHRGPFPESSAATLHLLHAQRFIVLAGGFAAGVLAWLRRLPALQAASLVWLTIFVVNPNFGFEYLIWGLPFFIAAGHLRLTAILQAAILPAGVLLYFRPGLFLDGWSYFVAVQVVWLGLLAVFVVAVRRTLRLRAPAVAR